MNLFTMTSQQTWELLAWTMCYFLAAGTVVALAGALVRFLCKRLAPQIRYAVSLGVFAILAMLPFGIAPWLAQTHDLPRVSVVADVANSRGSLLPATAFIELKGTGPGKLLEQQFTPQTEAAYSAPVVPAPAPELFERTIKFLPWLWLIGTPLTFLLLATGLIGSNRLRRQCKQLTEGPIFETCERLRSTLAVSQRVGIAIHKRIATPLLIGILRPMILLPPAALTGWSPDQLEMVLLHELAHVRRWDNLVNFGQRLVESLLFFHPAVWWVSRWVRRDREECCDAVVVARTEKPQAYAELLVALATPTPPLAGLALSQHPLAGRIRRILHLEEEKMLITRSTLGLVGLFVVAVLGFVLWQPVTPTVAEETPIVVAEQKELTTEDTESAEKTTSQGVSASNQPSPFPTLEAQRSADLAYKLLGVELEPLNKKELARVKAMKFAGGLRVAKGIRKSKNSTPLIAFGDLLVGLHVWPTTSLADVKKVLERDDLEDLSPLKFYVIRKVISRTNRGDGYGEMGGYSKTVDKLATGRIEVNTSALKKQPRSSVFGDDPFAPSILDKPSLLYDNRTFSSWKSSWRRDLSIGLRTKAVRAFVAFANAGKGKEAVDEIMAIAGEYEWKTIGGNGVTEPLQQACVDAFQERQLPIDVAVEAVIAAKDSKIARIRAFLPYVIGPLSSIDKEANKRLRMAFPELKLLTTEELRAKWRGLGGSSPAPIK